MGKYVRGFTSMDGKVFAADVYSVLAAFEVDCPARQHAIKKLLMPGQRGAKGEIQDLDEALVSVSRAVDMARARLPENGTLAGEPMTEPEPEPEPKPKPKPKLVTWERCVRIEPWQIGDRLCSVKWYPSEKIPEDWYRIDSYGRPIETIKRLPEGQEP
jgi:hypothetical protein